MNDLGISHLVNYLGAMGMLPQARVAWVEDPRRKCLRKDCNKLQAKGKPWCSSDCARKDKKAKKGMKV